MSTADLDQIERLANAATEEEAVNEKSTYDALVAEVRRLRVTPPAVELTDRELALAVRRWAVANGWTCHRWHGWINAATESAATIGVDWSTEDEDVTLRRRDPSGWWRYDVYPVGSLTQAVDLLAALGVLPAELSSAYRAGRAARP